MLRKNNSLVLKFSNISLDKLVIKLRKINVEILFIQEDKDYIYVTIKNSDLKNIHKFLKYLDYSLYKYNDLSYILFQVKKYAFSSLLLLISVIIIIISSYTIVDIKINTDNIELKEKLIKVLKMYDIKPLSIKKKYDDINKIKEQIIFYLSDDLEWIEIKTVGMNYVVDMEMRKESTFIKDKNYCNIYAKKEGIIKRIITYKGQNMVINNDYVKKDQLLISGDIFRDEKIINHVCANGKVYAEVWYKIDISIPYIYYDSVYTGKKRINFLVQTKDNEYLILKNRLNNYDSKKEIIFDALGIKIYLQKDYEIEKREKRYTENEIVNQALKLAYDKVKDSLVKDEKIISQNILQKESNDSTMNIVIFIITEEQLGYQMDIKEEVENGIQNNS